MTCYAAQAVPETERDTENRLLVCRCRKKPVGIKQKQIVKTIDSQLEATTMSRWFGWMRVCWVGVLGYSIILRLRKRVVVKSATCSLSSL